MVTTASEYTNGHEKRCLHQTSSGRPARAEQLDGGRQTTVVRQGAEPEIPQNNVSQPSKSEVHGRLPGDEADEAGETKFGRKMNPTQRITDKTTITKQPERQPTAQQGHRLPNGSSQKVWRPKVQKAQPTSVDAPTSTSRVTRPPTQQEDSSLFLHLICALTLCRSFLSACTIWSSTTICKSYLFSQASDLLIVSICASYLSISFCTTEAPSKLPLKRATQNWFVRALANQFDRPNCGTRFLQVGPFQVGLPAHGCFFLVTKNKCVFFEDWTSQKRCVPVFFF